ncbi:hypothetical protein QTI33_31925 [Variovorax sp. J22P271]|uniref:hypothetical protein n=1 Tax=Variovorax davisae TaxID=3053515 RepID=UPI0025786766|nr:hypothetical protein [Variovorax sp. J22P271]MDM0036782.1 hypothetical protein [Variovorax sp. J22P271]
MRPSLANPFDDQAKLAAAVELAEELYFLQETGRPVAEVLGRLGDLLGKPFEATERLFIGAFGAVSPETFARQLLVETQQTPRDLSRVEMLELVDRIFHPSAGEEFLTEYWVECLRLNTGDDRISDLIFWPGEYFGDGDNGRQMTPDEILDTALSARA